MDIQRDIDQFKSEISKNDYFLKNLEKNFQGDFECFFQLNKEGGFLLHEAKLSFEAWKTAKATVAEGFVLAEKSKIKTWYQDDDEPENFCYEADSLDDLGDCLDNDEIIQVNKIEEAIIQTTPLFGVWKFKFIGGQVERDRFVLCLSEVEASAIRDEYRRMLGLQAQEPTCE